MSYSKLQAENDKAIAALKSIIEERDKERASENKREKEYGIIDKDIRDFCKSILSKRDMNSGEDPGEILKNSLKYDKMSTKTLIAETKKAREEYDEGRIDLMRQLHNENSDLKKAKKNLEEHYRINKEVLSNNAEEKKQFKKDIAKLSLMLHEAKKEVEVSPIRLTGKDAKRKAMIMEESETLNVKKRIEDIKLNEREKEIAETVNRVLNNPAKDSKEERARQILKVVGDTGLSLRPDIENEVRERMKDKFTDADERFSTTKLNAAFTFLTEQQLMKKDSFINNKAKVTFYILTGLGNRVFYDIEGKEAAEAEFSKVTANHNNPEHGYGIVNVAKIMRQYPKRFSNISEFNVGKQGVYFVSHIVRENEEGDLVSVEKTTHPDIAFDEDYEQRFIEYEMVTQSKDEYYRKFDSYISYGVKMLIYIFPSKKVKDEFVRYVESYKEEKEAEGILYDVDFYLYTTDEFETMCEGDKEWKPYEKFDKETDSQEDTVKKETESKLPEKEVIKEVRKRPMPIKKQSQSNIGTSLKGKVPRVMKSE